MRRGEIYFAALDPTVGVAAKDGVQLSPSRWVGVIACEGHAVLRVDQQHRDPVVDAVGAPQPRVVQQCLGLDVEQRAAISRADQDVQEGGIEHDQRPGIGIARS